MPAILTAPTAAPALRTITSPKGKQVTTAYTYGQAFRLLRTHPGAFAEKLVQMVDNGEILSLNQAVYVYVLAEEVCPSTSPSVDPNDAEFLLSNLEAAEEVAEPVAAIPPAPYAPIIALFSAAREKGAKRLCIRVNIDGLALVLSNAPDHGTNAGGVYVKSAGATDEEGEKVYYGCITPEGGFKGSRDCTGNVTRCLDKFAKDPAGACAAYGQRTGQCCFCGRLLTDDGENRSVTVGYGPKCAGKYGLPWG